MILILLIYFVSAALRRHNKLCKSCGCINKNEVFQDQTLALTWDICFVVRCSTIKKKQSFIFRCNHSPLYYCYIYSLCVYMHLLIQLS